MASAQSCAKHFVSGMSTGRGDPFNFNDIYAQLGADGLVHRPMKMAEQKKVQATPETGERHSMSSDLNDLIEVTLFGAITGNTAKLNGPEVSGFGFDMGGAGERVFPGVFRWHCQGCAAHAWVHKMGGSDTSSLNIPGMTCTCMCVGSSKGSLGVPLVPSTGAQPANSSSSSTFDDFFSGPKPAPSGGAAEDPFAAFGMVDGAMPVVPAAAAVLPPGHPESSTSNLLSLDEQVASGEQTQPQITTQPDGIGSSNKTISLSLLLTQAPVHAGIHCHTLKP